MNPTVSDITVLGSGTFQRGLINSIQEIAERVHVLTTESSHKSCFSETVIHHQVDFNDLDGLASLVKNTGSKQVLTAGSEYFLKIQSELCKRLGLRAYSPEYLELFRDKLNYKSRLVANGTALGPRTFFENQLEALTECDSGVIVKPRLGAGSRDVVYEENPKRLFTNLDLLPSDLLVEEFIEGQELGGDFIVVEGRLEHYFATHKKVNGYLVPQIHLMLESIQHDELLERFLNEIIRSLSLRDGIYNVDMIAKGREVKLIDLSPRIGGNCIPDLIKTTTGIDEWRLLASWLLNDSSLCAKGKWQKPAGVFILGSDADGILTHQEKLENCYLKENINELYWTQNCGDKVRRFDQGANHLGYITFHADSDHELIRLSEEISAFSWYEIN